MENKKNIVTQLLKVIGEDPNRPGLLETPKRVVESWKELYSGYTISAESVLSKVFDSDNDQMVICKDIEFYSMCEHHMLPFTGKIHIGYLPKGKVVGLSKLARCTEVFSRRLQIQEQLTNQIAQAIYQNVPCRGVGVVIEAKHYCMCARGVGKQHSSMTTSALLDEFRTPDVKQEFISLIGLK